MPPSVAILSCRPLPEPDPDEALLVDALRAAGARSEVVAWNDEPSLAAFDVAVLRSTWDYHEYPDRFVTWCARAATETTLLNPLRVIRANVDKHYLAALAARGVPVVPTRFVDAASDRSPQDVARAAIGALEWKRFVVKPTVSAGSARTRSFTAEQRDDAAAFLAELLASGDAMVQPYLESVEGRTGSIPERSLVHVDGELTHVIEKRPRFAGEDESVSGAIDPEDDERRLAQHALAAWRDAVGDDALLYARVDVMRADDGTAVISELELLEPSLFLLQHPPALERLVRALLRTAGRPS